MTKMTHQEAFTKAYLGLKAQGFERAITGRESEYGPACMYRTDDGKKCAFGHLIPDELYTPKFEGNSVHYFFNPLGLYDEDKETKKAAIKIVEELFDEGDASFLRQLQICHDDGNTPPLMKQLLEQFAFENNLTIPIEDSEQEEVKS